MYGLFVQTSAAIKNDVDLSLPYTERAFASPCYLQRMYENLRQQLVPSHYYVRADYTLHVPRSFFWSMSGFSILRGEVEMCVYC